MGKPIYQHIFEIYETKLKEFKIEVPRESLSLLELVLRSELPQTIPVASPTLKEPVDYDFLGTLHPTQRGTRIIRGVQRILKNSGREDKDIAPLINEHLLQAYELWKIPGNRRGIRHFGSTSYKTLGKYLENKGLLTTKNHHNL